MQIQLFMNMMKINEFLDYLNNLSSVQEDCTIMEMRSMITFKHMQ
jgi:hypothetical protein